MFRKTVSMLVAMLAFVAMLAALAGCSQASDREGEGVTGSTEESAPMASENAVGSEVANGEDAASADDSLRTYTVVHVDGEPDWENVPQIDIDNQQWLDPVDITAHAQLCYGDDAFYVRMWAREANIRAECPRDDLLANTYEDSCLEFFISPVAGDARYLNFEFNPNCALCLQIGTSKTDRTRLVRTDDLFQAVSTRTEDGWEITYRIPFDFVRSLYPDFSAESGTILRGNFYKCGNLTVQKHYLSWSPIESDTPNFHLPEYFGVLVLE